MECLRDYIGIYGCSSPSPLSGIYINQLSGISLESVDKLANEDQVTYLAVWDDVQTRGLRRFTTNVIAYFKTKYRLKQLLDRLTFGLSMTTEDLPPANEYRGIRVTLNPDRDSPMVSPLISIAFDKIQFYSDGYVGNLTFVIGDPNIGVIFTTIVAVVDGWNTVIEHWQSPVIECPRSLSLAVNCSLLSTIKTVIPTTSSSGCGCDCACVCLSDCCSAKVEGITYRNTAVSITPDNAHGFKGYVSMKCSYDGLVCVNKDLFSTALWYLLGSEMMLERINSPRINKFTTVDLKKAKELQEYFEGMWKQELGIVIDSIDLNDGDCCLECDPVISYRETIL